MVRGLLTRLRFGPPKLAKTAISRGLVPLAPVSPLADYPDAAMPLVLELVGLIVGERRLRACKLLGWQACPGHGLRSKPNPTPACSKADWKHQGRDNGPTIQHRALSPPGSWFIAELQPLLPKGTLLGWFLGLIKFDQ
jgi:hypothetical protein